MIEINVPYQFPNVLSGIIVSNVAGLLPNAVLRSGKAIEKLTIDYQFDSDGRYWTIGLEFVHDEFNYHASDNDIVELFLEINRDQVCLCLSKGGDRDKVVISSKLKKVETLRDLSDQVNIALNILFERFKSIYGLNIQSTQRDSDDGEIMLIEYPSATI